MKRAPRARLAALVFSLLLLGGCASGPPLGPIAKPDVYPGQSEPGEAFWTFLWAWHTGDVPVLRGVFGMWLSHDLNLKLERQGAEAVSQWYARGAESLTLEEIEWNHEGDSLAYVRVLLSTSEVDRAELDFSLLRRPDGWVVSGKRLLR